MIYLKKIFKDIDIFFKLRKIKKHKKYKIIPLGTYCLPRTITTISGIKPRKKDGEKSLPFDLVFFHNTDAIANLISTKFEHFFDKLEFSTQFNCWENKDFRAIFAHDENISKEDFIKRYSNRIKNFYEYLSDKTQHAYFLFADNNNIDKSTLTNIRNAILNFRKPEEFDIIIINQSPDENNEKIENVHIINQNENIKNFELINDNGGWAGNLKKRNTEPAQKIYYEIIYGILNIIK